ncbi:uncharacterized protein B0T15DRAFT_492769 [Chaetomium strumarium]|uniref:Uncharacterized protein n=1 Tax=Chaetomium strumarium TaxID=1170767 RepID=A0AAJ0GW78_9PEZI|nr:hypothetical protein B0T15DRAFT_492769 [Chaetomium strumarium]
MAPQDDDLLPENTSGYKLSQPKHSLAEYQKMGAWTGGYGQRHLRPYFEHTPDLEFLESKYRILLFDGTTPHPSFTGALDEARVQSVFLLQALSGLGYHDLHASSRPFLYPP